MKITTTTWLCDRCRKKVSNDPTDKLHRYRLVDGHTTELCDACDCLLGSFLKGEAIPALVGINPSDDACPTCGMSLDEFGVCHNTMCANSPDFTPIIPDPTLVCPACNSPVGADGVCHNTDCTVSPDYRPSQTCPYCGEPLGPDGTCSSVECSAHVSE